MEKCKSKLLALKNKIDVEVIQALPNTDQHQILQKISDELHSEFRIDPGYRRKVRKP